MSFLETLVQFFKIIDKPVWEGEVGAGAHRDCIALLALARDLAGEGRALDVLVRELGRHLEISGWCTGPKIITTHGLGEIR